MSVSITTRRDAGFTLAEALVSLFVFALVAGGGVTVLAQSLNAQGRVGDAQEALRSLQSARALLTQDLAQLAPRVVREEGQPLTAFRAQGGVRPSIAFVRGVGERGSEDGLSTSLVAVEYSLDGEGRLVRRQRRALDGGPDAPTQTRVLLAGARDVRFEFNAGGPWVADWPSAASGVPHAVAIVATVPHYGAIRLQAMTGL